MGKFPYLAGPGRAEKCHEPGLGHQESRVAECNQRRRGCDFKLKAPPEGGGMQIHEEIGHGCLQ
jgi:hypothetical protein